MKRQVSLLVLTAFMVLSFITGCNKDNTIQSSNNTGLDSNEVTSKPISNAGNTEEIIEEPPLEKDAPIIEETPINTEPQEEPPKEEKPTTPIQRPTPKPQEVTQQIPEAKPEIDKYLEPYLNSTKEIAKSAQGYYGENYNKSKLVSYYGRLHNATYNMDLDTNFLCDNGYLNNKYRSYGCDILLLKPSDVSEFSGLDIPKDTDLLGIFVSTKIPNEDSYLIATARSFSGKLSSSQYSLLLKRYNQNNGAVGRLNPNTTEYERILNFISMYESRFSNYYVRSITKDNKYAVVVLSSTSNVNDIRQYVLRKDNNIWEVVLDRLENEPRVYVAINKRLPDFNPNLLPKYTIYEYKSLLLTDYTGVMHSLVFYGYVNSIDEISYIAGADKFCYVMLKNQSKFVCKNAENGWSIAPVYEYDEAYKILINESVLAPTFILLDK